MLKGLIKTKNFWRFFAILFLLSFLVLNWNEIFWIFNWKAVSGKLFGSQTKEITEITEPAREKDAAESGKEPAKAECFGKQAWLEIPKIGIKAPIVFIEQDLEKEYEQALKKGVLHYPSPFLQEGQTTIILGHSASENWPEINYDKVFSDLEELVLGDRIYIFCEQKEYIFEAEEKVFLEPGQEIPFFSLTESETMLVLVSCWPPGSDIKRIAVPAKLAGQAADY